MATVPSEASPAVASGDNAERADRDTGGGAGGPVMHIGEVATRTDLSVRSLRHWEEVGLLAPSGRTDGGFRLYTEDDVEKILVIRRMKPLGFSLEQMKAVMADIETLRNPTSGEDARARARVRLVEVQDDAAERRKKLVVQLEMADEFMTLLRREAR